MKIWDVDLFQDGLQRNITMLDRLSGEMEAIHHAVEGLVQMEEQFKGAGGNAIRSFYQECHLPFLHFFQLFSEQFKQVLQQMEAALHSLEPDSTGYILEPFLEGELEQGLTLIGRLTASLTDEANSIMDQVSDIVGLPHLDDSGVQEGVIRSKRKRDDTNSQLYEFDATQTTVLHPIEQDLQTMNTWLTDMEGLFQAGVKDISFVPSQWNVLTFRSEIRTELFPKVYSNPNDLWVKEHQQLIGTMITTATFQTLEGKKVNTVKENLDENIKYHMYENGLLIKEYVVGQTVFYEVVSKVDYREEETVKVDKPKENKLLDSFQFGLDLAGLIPVVGEVADGVNGVIYTARGDALNAALSFGAMIPVAGWASTGGKLALKGTI
ncbi:T7SS effector LXG polymorphic toxin [Sporosarcina sp. FSL K6-6792]|uniref:ribonuclease YeeF family protein n=1 Tax=Sporosarcina sp. FSL K6-6792 TaxID=2921559 RepID=UPI0030F4FD0D